MPGNATETTFRYVKSLVAFEDDLYEILGATCCDQLGLRAESLQGTHSTELPPMIESCSPNGTDVSLYVMSRYISKKTGPFWITS